MKLWICAGYLVSDSEMTDLTTYDLTDVGNAERFSNKYKDKWKDPTLLE